MVSRYAADVRATITSETDNILISSGKSIINLFIPSKYLKILTELLSQGLLLFNFGDNKDKATVIENFKTTISNYKSNLQKTFDDFYQSRQNVLDDLINFREGLMETKQEIENFLKTF